MLDIPGLDHLILAGDRDMWFAEAGVAVRSLHARLGGG
jgi:hypothetical protein